VPGSAARPRRAGPMPPPGAGAFSVEDQLAAWEHDLELDGNVSQWERELSMAETPKITKASARPAPRPEDGGDDDGSPGSARSRKRPLEAACETKRRRDGNGHAAAAPAQPEQKLTADGDLDAVWASRMGLQHGELSKELLAQSSTPQLFLGISALLEFMIGDTEPADAAGGQPSIPTPGKPSPLDVFACDVGAAATMHNINEFLVDMARICQYTLECNVIALILLIRILSYHPYLKPETRTWRRYLLCALMIAQKFWDERCLRNIDFTIAWKCVLPTARALELREVNLMERHFLAGLGYDLYIQPKKYSACLTEVLSIVVEEKPAYPPEDAQKEDAQVRRGRRFWLLLLPCGRARRLCGFAALCGRL